MYFVVHYEIRPDAAQLRERHHATHIAFRRELGDRVLVSGPLLERDSQEVRGSLLILKAGNLAEAEAAAADDPLVRAGAYTVRAVTPFLPMAYHAPE